MDNRRYDFVLVIVAIAVLTMIGALFLGATFWSWVHSLADPSWSSTPEYQGFVVLMDRLLSPLLVGIILILGLCLPKRLFAQGRLALANIIMLCIASLAGLIYDGKTGLSVFILECLALQSAVLLMTFFVGSSMRFETEGYWSRSGSALLHFGFILLAAAFVVWGSSAYHMDLFWAGTLALVAGNSIAFYSDSIAAQLQRQFKPKSDQALDPFGEA